jgi:hypothetical protein
VCLECYKLWEKWDERTRGPSHSWCELYCCAS